MGYGEQGAIAVCHQRAVLFLNERWILLVDYLEGEGAHSIESRFAVAPLPFQQTERGLRTVSGEGDLDIQFWSEQLAAIEIAHGRTEPFEGWMPDGSYDCAPHPLLIYRLEAELPLCLLTLLTPFEQTGDIPRAEVAWNRSESTLTALDNGRETSIRCGRAPLDIRVKDSEFRFQAKSSGGERLGFCYSAI